STEPTRAEEALGTIAPGSYLHRLVVDAETEAELGADSHLEQFLASFHSLDDTTRDNLRSWVRRTGDAELTSPLGLRVVTAVRQWQTRVEELNHRRTAVEAQLPELKAKAEAPTATEEDKGAL